MPKLEVQYTFLNENKECANRYNHKVVGYDFNTKQLIDLRGRIISVDFNQQPPWCDIKQDGQKFSIPPFYVKRSNMSIFISSQQINNFNLHPAFNGVSQRLWIVTSTTLDSFTEIGKKLPCEDLSHCDACPLRFQCYTGGGKLISYLSLNAIELLSTIELGL